MGCLLKLSLAVVVSSVITGYFIHKILTVPELPKLTLTYWGPGEEKPDDKRIKPFKINFPQSELQELRKNLDKPRSFTPPLEGVGFEYGFNSNYMSTIIDFWMNKYNWTARLEYLNSFPQYTTQIGGLDIHFLHVKVAPDEAKGKTVLPLLILHGWPSSVREFYKIIPMLNTPRADTDFVFEVIAPSLPGHTFSQGASKPGLGAAQIAVILDELMSRLGHQKYYIHGGDWGSFIGLDMSLLFPNKVLAYHSTFCTVGVPKARLMMVLAYMFPQYLVEESRQEQYVSQFIDMYVLESGYLHIQSTKPDTIGIALSDSPVGLAAYFLEKFGTWTNKDWRPLPHGGIENMDKVELIDNIMLYWLTKSITTSMRIYSETFNKKYSSLGIERNVNTVPSGCAWFKYEVIYNPQIVLESAYQNLVQVSHFPTGGHFSAFEEPKLVSEDIIKLIKTVRTPKVESN